MMRPRSARAVLVILAAISAAQAGRARITNPGLRDELSPAAQQVLDRHGMVACATGAEQMYDIYNEAADRKLPILVTTDPVFHVFHILYDYSLRAAELDFFYPDMERILAGLLDFEQSRYAREEDAAAKHALLMNVAYLSVPLSLLRPGYAPPGPASALVQAELERVESLQPDRSAIMDYLEDFSQYRPRGHYTRNERFRRYFKAMMYLGRMTFRLPGGSGSDVALEPTRRAILLSEALETAQTDSGVPVKDIWQRLYAATAYLVGRSDDVLPSQYYALACGLAGDQPLSTWVLSDANICEFCDTAADAFSRPRILGDVVGSGTPFGMRLMGQRYIPDSHVFHNLTYNRIPDRLLPMGLDVMAALGSDRARDHLVRLYRQDAFPGYLARLDSMRAEFATFDSSEWHQSAYYGWLYALKLNLEPVRPQSRRAILAPFLTSTAYPDKTLVTTSGSWAQLRHDTILYAKQSYSATVGCHVLRREPPLSAYVEPKPMVFRQLASLGRQLRDTLSSMGRLNTETDSKLADFAAFTDQLARISDGELSGQQMSESDAELCRGIGAALQRMTTFSEGFSRTYLSELPEPETARAVAPQPRVRFDPRTGRADTVGVVAVRPRIRGTINEDRKMALVADVHTDPNDEVVLEVAVGNPMRLYAVVPCWRRNHLAVGACFSYYEFTKPMSQRMTDAEWQELSPKPPMPEWTRSFIAP